MLQCVHQCRRTGGTGPPRGRLGRFFFPGVPEEAVTFTPTWMRPLLLNNDADVKFKFDIDKVEFVDRLFKLVNIVVEVLFKLLIDNVEFVDKLLIDNIELVDKLFKLVVNAYTETALGVPVIDVVVD